jgi:chemotaxis protein methyltransferase CheR
MERNRNGMPQFIGAGPMPLSDRTYRRVCDLVQGHFGIHLAAEKQCLIVNRLHNHVQALGFNSYEAYLDHVETDVSGAALDTLASLISTNHTYFFREEAHFDFLTTHALPSIESALARAGDHDLRLWCAAASTGEEAYSIAMTLLDYFGLRYGRYDAGLLATDLSLKALRQAATGVYTREQVQRVPPHLRQRYLRQRDDKHWMVMPEVRSEVLFRKFNLMAARYPFKKPFHAIFCRNVMIYFDAPTRRRLVQRLYDFTAPGGYLFVGHSESIDREATGYRAICPAVYRRPADAREGR